MKSWYLANWFVFNLGISLNVANWEKLRSLIADIDELLVNSVWTDKEAEIEAGETLHYALLEEKEKNDENCLLFYIVHMC